MVILRPFSSSKEILRELSHPNLVQALDFLEYSCGVALVLSYLPGSTMSQVVKHGRLSESTARPLFKQLMEALGYLHRHRVVHGDVKSDNLIVSLDQKKLHLTDFGSSRALKGGLKKSGHVHFKKLKAPSNRLRMACLKAFKRRKAWEHSFERRGSR